MAKEEVKFKFKYYILVLRKKFSSQYAFTFFGCFDSLGILQGYAFCRVTHFVGLRILSYCRLFSLLVLLSAVLSLVVLSSVVFLHCRLFPLVVLSFFFFCFQQFCRQQFCRQQFCIQQFCRIAGFFRQQFCHQQFCHQQFCHQQFCRKTFCHEVVVLVDVLSVCC